MASEEADSIELGRDVPIEGLTGRATSLVATPGGGFVVTGSTWAVATDSNGRVRWRYPYSGSDVVKTADQSKFNSAATLNNGNTLLCGNERTAAGSAGLMVILNREGQLVEKRPMQPPGSGQYYAVRIDRCVRWDDGIAAIGGAAKDNAGIDWLMRLDGNGAKQWELIGRPLIGIDAVETTEHNLVMASTDVVTRTTTLVQFNQRGQMVSKKPLPGYPDNVVRSAMPTSTLKVLTNIDRPNTEVVTLDAEFAQIAPPHPTSIQMTINGCAWVLWDGSVAVFGNRFAPGGVYRSTVARIARSDRPDQVRFFSLSSSQTISASVYDAVPISDRTFVAVRDVNGAVVLSWVTFK